MRLSMTLFRSAAVTMWAFVAVAQLTLPVGRPAAAEDTHDACNVQLRADAKRIAVVIGNGAYPKEIGRLRNPANDAQAISSMLLDLGFGVVTVVDAEAAGMSQCVEQALTMVEKPEVALLYYSGHGIQIKDTNYLVATDADPEVRRLDGFVPLRPIVEKLQTVSQATLVFLDACRNNPLPSDGEGLSVATVRNLKRGLKRVEQDRPVQHASGLFVAYATSPNSVALDGAGEYSPFTQAILKIMPRPGYSIQRVMSEVTNEVGRATLWSQTPWVRSSLTSELKLSGANTLKQAQSQSENWARRSAALLAKGRREEAIAAALKGLPTGLEDEDFADFAAAHDALYSAMRDGNTWLPIKDEVFVYTKSPDGRYLAAVGRRSSHGYPTRVWDVREKKIVLRLFTDADSTAMPYWASAFSPDGRRFAFADKEGSIAVWDIDTREKASEFSYAGDNGATWLEVVEFSPTGDRVLTLARDPRTIRIWDIVDGRFAATLASGDMESIVGQPVSEWSPGGVDAHFITDDILCLGVNTAGSVREGEIVVGRYRVSTKRFIPIMRIEDVSHLHNAICSDNGLYASVLYRADDSEHYAHRVMFKGAPDRYDSAAGLNRADETSFSPDSKYLMVRFWDKWQFLDLETAKTEPAPYGGRTELPGYDILFNAKGERLANLQTVTDSVLWKKIPDKAALVRKAIEVLDADLVAEVEQDRVKYTGRTQTTKR